MLEIWWRNKLMEMWYKHLQESNGTVERWIITQTPHQRISYGHVLLPLLTRVQKPGYKFWHLSDPQMITIRCPCVLLQLRDLPNNRISCGWYLKAKRLYRPTGVCLTCWSHLYLNILSLCPSVSALPKSSCIFSLLV